MYAKGGDYTPESLNREEKAALVLQQSDRHFAFCLCLMGGKSRFQKSPAP